ncbi:MAG TPA: hypothetical protein VMS75_11065 [Terriglobales bacterium]|nr:hypothetical protein [Terriglobales bacterium]
MNKLPLLGLLGMTVLRLSLGAVTPQKWELRTREDFLRGKFDGISVSSDGALGLAPKEEKVASPTEEFYLSVLLAADGATFLGTGHGGKVYRIGPDGKAEVWFQAPEMDVTCLAQDKRGALYAATSPNGKIYRITERGKAETFFDPAEKYIWDLLFMDSGQLWAAVGETAGIYEINPQGEGRMIFKAAENHLLCLKKTGRGDVLAGSGGNGVVYRISAEGRASVVYETAYEEVRSLDLDRDGVIYAAASGAPTRSRRDDLAPMPARTEPGLSVPGGGATVTASVTAVSVPGVSGAGVVESLAAVPAAARESGALYRISADGLAKVLWSSTEEMIYTLLWRADERRVLFGTGSKGRLYAVDKDEKVSLLAQENSEQVFELVPLDSKVYVLANNPCYLGRLLPEQRLQGEYVGPVADARTLATWGRISWEGTADAGSGLQLQTRSGNTYEPNATWSEWSPPYQKKEEQVLSPKARYLQVKAVLRSPTGRVSPVLDTLTVFYLQANIAPAVTRLDYLKPNEVFLKMPEQEDVILGLEKNPAEAPAKKDDGLRIVIPPKKAERKGFQTITWEASDENGDALVFTLALRKEGETEWRAVADGWPDSPYTFDTTAYPDGTYYVKITASDAPSNPAGLELTGERVGPPLVIDNSLPLVKSFTAARNGASLDVAFQAEDSFSNILEVKYLVRPGEWRVVFPVDGIADSRSESYKFSVRIPAGAENMITVRVKDAYGNVGVYRQNF